MLCFVKVITWQMHLYIFEPRQGMKIQGNTEETKACPYLNVGDRYTRKYIGTQGRGSKSTWNGMARMHTMRIPGNCSHPTLAQASVWNIKWSKTSIAQYFSSSEISYAWNNYIDNISGQVKKNMVIIYLNIWSNSSSSWAPSSVHLARRKWLGRNWPNYPFLVLFLSKVVDFPQLPIQKSYRVKDRSWKRGHCLLGGWGYWKAPFYTNASGNRGIGLAITNFEGRWVTRLEYYRGWLVSIRILPVNRCFWMPHSPTQFCCWEME